MTKYVIPNAASTLGAAQLLYNSFNQYSLRVFTNNPGPTDTTYSDYLSIASSQTQQSILTMITSLKTALDNIKIFLPLAVSSPGIAVSGTTATFNTAVPHNFSNGNKVVISNSSVAGLNTATNAVTTIVSATPGTTTFTYTVASGTAADTGTTASVQCFSLT